LRSATFLQGTVILATAGFLNRFIGFFYNLYLIRWVGPEPIGIYRMVTPVYFTLLLVATAGIPYAISKLVSERVALGKPREALRTVKIAVAILTVLSSAVSTAFYLLAPLLSNYIFSDPRTYWVVIFLVPCIFVVSLAAILRGFFQGLQQMEALAVSSFLEQVTHAVSTLALALYLAPRGPGYVAAGIAVGMVLGELVGLVTLSALFLQCRKTLLEEKTGRPLGRPEPPSTTIKRMFDLSLPVTAGRIAASLSTTFNITLIPARLRASGLSTAEATTQFGQLTGIALPLIFLPNIINVAMAINLVPDISAALARRDLRSVRLRTQKALTVTYLLGLPVVATFLVLARQICEVAYNYPEAGTLVAIMAPAAVLAYLRQTTSGILQGLGKPSIPVRNYILALCADTSVVFFLAAVPGFGIRGAAVASLVNFLVGGGLNLYGVFKEVGFTVNIANHLVKPFAAALVCALTIKQVYHTLLPLGSLPVATFGSAAAGLVAYAAIILVTGAARPLRLTTFKKPR